MLVAVIGVVIVVVGVVVVEETEEGVSFYKKYMKAYCRRSQPRIAAI